MTLDPRIADEHPSGLRFVPQRLVVVAGVLVDVILYIPALPPRGGDVVAQKWLMTTGGGFNVMTAAARLQMAVAFGGQVGTGFFGQRVQQDLRDADIPVLLHPVRGDDTGFDIGLVEPGGERTFVTAAGVEARPSAALLASLPLVAGDAVYVSGDYLVDEPSGEELAAWASVLPDRALLVLDPGPRAGEIHGPRLDRVLRRTDLLTVNRREAGLLTGTIDPGAALGYLRSRLPEAAVAVVRAGELGCWFSSDTTGLVHVPARPTHAVDTNGAGDVHTGALLARLSRGDSLATAALVANVAASLSIESLGPAAGPTEDVVADAMSRTGPDWGPET